MIFIANQVTKFSDLHITSNWTSISILKSSNRNFDYKEGIQNRENECMTKASNIKSKQQ